MSTASDIPTTMTSQESRRLSQQQQEQQAQAENKEQQQQFRLKLPPPSSVATTKTTSSSSPSHTKSNVASSESSRYPDTGASSSNTGGSDSSGSDDGQEQHSRLHSHPRPSHPHNRTFVPTGGVGVGTATGGVPAALSESAITANAAAAASAFFRRGSPPDGEVSALSSSNDGSNDERQSNKSEQDVLSSSNSSSGGSTEENEKKVIATSKSLLKLKSGKSKAKTAEKRSRSGKQKTTGKSHHCIHHHGHRHSDSKNKATSLSSPAMYTTGRSSTSLSTKTGVKKRKTKTARKHLSSNVASSVTGRTVQSTTPSTSSTAPFFMDEPIPPNETKEEKKRRMNRITAKKKRARQKIEVDVLNEQRAELTSLNNALQSENDNLEHLLQKANQIVAQSGMEPVEAGSTAAVAVVPASQPAVALTSKPSHSAPQGSSSFNGFPSASNAFVVESGMNATVSVSDTHTSNGHDGGCLSATQEQALQQLVAVGVDSEKARAILQQLASGSNGTIAAQLQQLLQLASGSMSTANTSQQNQQHQQQYQIPVQLQSMQPNFHQQQVQPQQNQLQASATTPLSSLAAQLQQLVKSGNLSSAQAQQLLVTAASNQNQMMNANAASPAIQTQGLPLFQTSNTSNGTVQTAWGNSNSVGRQQVERNQFAHTGSVGQMDFGNQHQRQALFPDGNGNAERNVSVSNQAQQLLGGNSSFALQAQQLLMSGGMSGQSNNASNGGSNSFSSQAQSLAEQIVRAAGANNVAQLLQQLGQQKQPHS